MRHPPLGEAAPTPGHLLRRSTFAACGRVSGARSMIVECRRRVATSTLRVSVPAANVASVITPDDVITEFRCGQRGPRGQPGHPADRP
jgi:hypothetical protein